MGEPHILERLSDRQRIVILLKLDGASLDEIGDFLGISRRMVRDSLTLALGKFPGLLDHRGERLTARHYRLAYLLGVLDAGGDPDELTDFLDCLVDRAVLLRARMVREEAAETLQERRRPASRCVRVS